MNEVESIPFEVFLIILGVSIASSLGALINWLRKRKNRLCEIHKELQAYQKEVKEDIDDLKKQSWRIQKTLLIMAQIMDDTLEKTHPDLRADLETIAQELLEHTHDN
ncbi:MAG TPA: hypothetical protein ENI23_09125 [bacterium]|nr:hypothetical protein [bacterium]